MSESKELSPQQKFEEKVKDRLRDSIGDLIPDEVLQEMIKKSVDDFFFKDTLHTTGSNSWDRKTEMRPGWFHRKLAEKLDRRLNKWVERWINQNGERMLREMEAQFVKDAPALILQAFTNKILHEAAMPPMQRIFEVESNLMNKKY